MEGNSFERASKFSLRKTKYIEKGRGRILLGDNIRVGVGVILRPIRFQCFEVWISVALSFIHMYLTICKYTEFLLAPGLPERSYCASQGVSVLHSNVSHEIDRVATARFLH